MKHRTTLGITFVALITGAGALYVMIAATPKTAAPAKSPAAIASDTPTTAADSSASKGIYVDYAPNIIASTSRTKLLFFHAPWCPQCRALDTDIKNSSLPLNVAIIKTDYDTHQDLRQKYGVTLQTTFVKVDNEGNLVEKYTAYNEPTFDSVKRNLLD
jgi:thiol-disulfide isomerase/thioredoxin